MKKITSLLVVMALLLMSLTAFAAPAVETDNIHVKFVADKATIAPGESATISVFISANGTSDVSFDTAASFGMIFDKDNFTYEVTKAGSFSVEDFSDAYGLLWALDESGAEYAANTSCVEVKFTAKADAEEKTYDFSVSEDAVDTGFQQGILDPFDPDMGNVTLTGAKVTVAKAAPAGATATAAETAGDITAYTIANDAAGDVDATEKVITKTFEGLTITDATRVYVTIDGEDRVFGSDLAEATNGLEIGKLTFGIIVKANVDLSKITEFDVR